MKSALLLAALLLGLALLPFGATGYILYIANLLMIFVILSLGLNLLIGETGQFALAHAAFYGIGIYAAALLNNLTGAPVVLTVLAGATLAAAIGLILGVVSLRMRDIYLALSTFAFGEAVRWVLANWTEVTGGPNGLRINASNFFGIPLVSDRDAYYLVLGATLMFTLATVQISRSRLGSAFRAVRESEIAAAAMGVNVRGIKIAAFALSAFYAGAAGGLFTSFSSFIHPESLGFMTTILVLTMIVVGGLGSVSGAVAGAVIFGLFSELLRQALSFQEIIYGAILMACMMYAPRGLVGLVRSTGVRG